VANIQDVDFPDHDFEKLMPRLHYLNNLQTSKNREMNNIQDGSCRQ